jgi:hypothetical protein
MGQAKSWRRKGRQIERKWESRSRTTARGRRSRARGQSTAGVGTRRRAHPPASTSTRIAGALRQRSRDARAQAGRREQQLPVRACGARHGLRVRKQGAESNSSQSEHGRAACSNVGVLKRPRPFPVLGVPQPPSQIGRRACRSSSLTIFQRERGAPFRMPELSRGGGGPIDAMEGKHA